MFDYFEKNVYMIALEHLPQHDPHFIVQVQLLAVPQIVPQDVLGLPEGLQV